MGWWGNGVGSAAGEGGDEVKFAGGGQAVAQTGGRDYPIYGDGDAGAQAVIGGQARGEAWEPGVQVGDDGADGGAAGLDMLGARSQVAMVGRDPDGVDHPFVHSASITRGGDMGSSVMRTPAARAMALATAPAGGTMGVSPTPRTPKGWPG